MNAHMHAHTRTCNPQYGDVRKQVYTSPQAKQLSNRIKVFFFQHAKGRVTLAQWYKISCEKRIPIHKACFLSMAEQALGQWEKTLHM